MKDKAQLIVDEIEADKMAAESKLEAAKPALQAAEAALQVTLSPPLYLHVLHRALRSERRKLHQQMASGRVSVCCCDHVDSSTESLHDFTRASGGRQQKSQSFTGFSLTQTKVKTETKEEDDHRETILAETSVCAHRFEAVFTHVHTQCVCMTVNRAGPVTPAHSYICVTIIIQRTKSS